MLRVGVGCVVGMRRVARLDDVDVGRDLLPKVLLVKGVHFADEVPAERVHAVRLQLGWKLLQQPHQLLTNQSNVRAGNGSNRGSAKKNKKKSNVSNVSNVPPKAK